MKNIINKEKYLKEKLNSNNGNVYWHNTIKGLMGGIKNKKNKISENNR